MSDDNDESNSFESLASKCRKVIAMNLLRYPIDSFSSLSEMEWENVIKVKYNMTSPKRSQNSATASISTSTSTAATKMIGSNLLSDGRKFPLLTDKFIQDVEDKIPHFRKSKIVDELVWKDNVDFKFPKASRPFIFDEPWNYQTERCEKIVEEMKSYYADDRSNDDLGHSRNYHREISREFSSSSISSNKSASNKPNDNPPKKKIAKIVDELQDINMSVPLLSTSGIGKALKKFMKAVRQLGSMDNSDNNMYNHWVPRLELILNNWKQMAKANGVAISSSSNNTNGHKFHHHQQHTVTSISGKSRHTSDEQHVQDVKDIQECHQWRDLFVLLVHRQENFIKAHGAKMRKIRDELEVGRPKIGLTRTKNIAKRVVMENGGGIQRTSEPMNKLGKLKHEFKQQKAIIRGGTTQSRLPSGGVTRNTFGSAVSSASSSSGKKRSLVTSSNIFSKFPKTASSGVGRRGTNREVVLNGNKKMKLPKLDLQYQRKSKR